MVKNAVQGTITLPLKIQNLDNSFQIINQTFLVLRETLTLPTILLGNDFLQANQSQITYDKNSVSLSMNGQNVKCITGSSDNSYFAECFKPTLPPNTTQTPPPVETVHVEPAFSIFPPMNFQPL